MKEIIKESQTTAILDWYMSIEFDKYNEPIWASDEDKAKGNFNGLSLHKGRVHTVTVMIPKNPNKKRCKQFISYEFSQYDILKIADRIKEIRKIEENLLCEIDG